MSDNNVYHLPNSSGVNASPPVSGYFDTMAEAEANTAVDQFALVADISGHKMWIITKKPDGTFVKDYWRDDFDYTKALPRVGVFPPLAKEGRTWGTGSNGMPGYGPTYAVPAAPKPPVKPKAGTAVGSTGSTAGTTGSKGATGSATAKPYVPVDNPSSTKASNVGGGWYLANIVSGRGRGSR